MNTAVSEDSNYRKHVSSNIYTRIINTHLLISVKFEKNDLN